MKSVNIISRKNNGGLRRDVHILSTLLRDAGYVVLINGGLEGADDCVSRPPYNINLFIEHIFPAFFQVARVNCLIPNQEWFRDECYEYLSELDFVLCKSRFAQSIFDKLGCKTEFISFSSLDRLNERHTMDYGKFFHLAGKSRQKGTQVILDLWKRHPDWPLLKVIQDPSNAQPVFAKNIEYTARHVDDTLLAKYQNLCGLHLCPSEAEGFGHYITEAMSCKAVTITTNSPPMNELVTNERGKLVSFSSIRNQRLGVNCYVASSDLEQKVEEVLCMSHSSKARLGENARDWYRQNDQFFRKKMLDVVKGV